MGMRRENDGDSGNRKDMKAAGGRAAAGMEGVPFLGFSGDPSFPIC